MRGKILKRYKDPTQERKCVNQARPAWGEEVRGSSIVVVAHYYDAFGLTTAGSGKGGHVLALIGVGYRVIHGWIYKVSR